MNKYNITFLTGEEDDAAFNEWLKSTRSAEKQIIKDYENGLIKSVYTNEYPDDDEIQFIELGDLKEDLSQGTGNVMRYYFYVPSLDIICIYISF